jgi:hypothetical protein
MILFPINPKRGEKVIGEGDFFLGTGYPMLLTGMQASDWFACCFLSRICGIVAMTTALW